MSRCISITHIFFEYMEILEADVIFISETKAPDRRAEKRRLAEAAGVSIDRLQLLLDI